MSQRPVITPARVLELKAEAAKLKAELGINHSAALARLAQREGYRSWEELIGLAGGAAAVREAAGGEPPTFAQMRHAERRAFRKQRYGGGAS